MSLVFVSEAASKADLYFPCKGGQIYCAGRLVIYGAGGAPPSLPFPCTAGTGQEAAGKAAGLLPACRLLDGVGMALGSCRSPGSDKPASAGMKKLLC